MDRVKYVSPECVKHDHYDCPVIRLNIKCECLCHKLVGEWQTLKARN